MPSIVKTFVMDTAWMIIPFLITYSYSWAILRGIASARDEHHRMTPQSPWYYFDREFQPRYRRQLGFLIPWVLLAVIVSHGTTIWAGGSVSWNPMYVTRDCLAHLSFVGFAWAMITLNAPRIARPEFLAGFGFFLGLIMYAIPVLSSEWIITTYIMPDEPNIVDSIAISLSVIIAIASYFAAWHRARRKLDRAWFRFDE